VGLLILQEQMVLVKWNSRLLRVKTSRRCCLHCPSNTAEKLHNQLTRLIDRVPAHDQSQACQVTSAIQLRHSLTAQSQIINYHPSTINVTHFVPRVAFIVYAALNLFGW